MLYYNQHLLVSALLLTVISFNNVTARREEVGISFLITK